MTPGRISMLGVEVDAVSAAGALDRIASMVDAGRPSLMVVVNASKLSLAHEDPTLRRILERADLVTADGMSVVWGARVLGETLPGRVTGIDTMESLVALAAERGWGVFFLGAKREAVELAVEKLRERHPSLVVAGVHDGYFRGREAEIAQMVRDAAPRLLFVAMGSPAQEMFLDAWLDTMGVPFSLGVGGSFDHVAGLSRRAPVWMQRAGMEWVHRLASEPRRLWRRYLFGNAKFARLLLRERLERGRGRAGAEEKQ